MATLSLDEGSIFSGRYRVLRCIAQGGMGAVYEVVHIETERRRALKVMHPHLVNSPELRERFRQEAKVAAHVDSQHIVDVFDAGIDEATQIPFLAMELLRGEELGVRLRRMGRFNPGEAVTYLYQTALALDKTHKAHIVHRDLKPENLFLTEQESGAPHVKVLDFGIAKFVAEGGTNANATRSIGTPLYMAPEQFRPGNRVSQVTDIYALGMMAYTFLTGRPYWENESRTSDNVFAFVTTVMNGPCEPPSHRAARSGVVLPPAFDEWFSTATAIDPAARFRSATAAVAGLASALGITEASFNASSSQPTPLSAQSSEQSGDPGSSPSDSESGLMRPSILARSTAGTQSGGTAPMPSQRTVHRWRGAVVATAVLLSLGCVGAGASLVLRKSEPTTQPAQPETTTDPNHAETPRTNAPSVAPATTQNAAMPPETKDEAAIISPAPTVTPQPMAPTTATAIQRATRPPPPSQAQAARAAEKNLIYLRD